MKWFKGNIAQAVQTSKAKQSVFIVYISGEDKVSEEVSTALENEEVESVRETGDCVAVKIKANSEDCGFFSQIYPVVVVPSIFFIGENGVPLEVTGGNISAEELVTKLTSVVELNKSKTQTLKDDGVQETQVTQAQETQVTQDTVAASTVQTAQPQRSKEELQKDVEKAQDILEKKKKDKLRKEAEEAKKKEDEKRRMGKDVQKLKQFQKETEMQEVQQQLKKEKEEDKIARQKIKEQIARDRADRAAKFSKDKQEKEETLSDAKKAKLQAEQMEKETAEARRSEFARIQFRLPDGSSLPHTFPSRDSLQTVNSFISHHIGETVVLSTTFPRRTFTDADLSLTLIDLQLAPSAVIMVVPTRKSVVQSQRGSSSSDIISLVLAPFMFIISLLRSLFGLSPAPSTPTASSPSPTATGGDRPTDQAFKRPPSGNIRRFRNTQDDDDENATWNGNSTQQM